MKENEALCVHIQTTAKVKFSLTGLQAVLFALHTQVTCHVAIPIIRLLSHLNKTNSVWVSFSAANEENFFPTLIYWEAPPVFKKKNYISCRAVMGCAQGKRELLGNDGSGFLMLELRVEQELAGQIQ